jgi:DNA-binding NarL/FixJ family response regulator
VAEVRVLVVDDSAPFRTAAAGVVRRAEGFVLVGEAVDGADAVAQVEALAPALVLMDVRMPGVDGPEATRRIAARWPEVRVVLCSTYDLEDLSAAARACGAAAYLHKEELRPAGLRELWDGLVSPPAAAAPG